MGTRGAGGATFDGATFDEVFSRRRFRMSSVVDSKDAASLAVGNGCTLSNFMGSNENIFVSESSRSEIAKGTRTDIFQGIESRRQFSRRSKISINKIPT